MEHKRILLTFYLLLILVGCLQVQGLSTERFYPFGSGVRDRQLPPNDDGSSGQVTISVSFPFFQKAYSKLFVNTNGVISFIANLEEFTPDTFPVDNGRRLIAPFWADVDIRNGGNVFYRESTDLEVLQRATSDVKQYFPQQFRSFRASWTFIATWHNVSHYIKTRRRSEVKKRPSNTFQVVLITNGRHSFAIFLYNKTEWTTGDASKGAFGQGGIPAQAGFNYGDGQRYYSIRGSRTRLVKDLPNLTNIGVPGKFMFRIDEARIQKGGCNTAGGITLSPKSGVVLGGTIIQFSGPCFNSSDLIVCRFGDITVDGNYETAYKASCVSPPLGKTGKIRLELSINNGTTFDFVTTFTSVPLGRHGPGISGIVAKDWYNLNPNFLAWNPQHVEDRKIQIEVAKFDWNTLQMLEKGIVVKTNVDNFGFVILENLAATAMPMSTNTSTKESEALLSPLAIVTIRAQNPKRGLPARIFSAPFLTIPMNMTDKLKQVFDNQGIHRKCKEWFGDDVTDVQKIRDELIPCPTSLEQAEADNGRFVSDNVCKPPRTTSCLVYHNGSFHCFRSRFPSRSGAGQQCCYNREGKLMVGPKAGGTIDRYHAGRSQFATLKHLKEDVYPWYLCCRLCPKCGLYYSNRPSDDGSRYRAPEITTTYGDPHLVTLDGLSYTFNGYGVYTMLHIEENGFIFQARMQPIILEKGVQSRGTFLMAFALKDMDSDTVQIELNSLKMIDIFVNEEEEAFETDVPEMDFEGVILTKRNDSVIQIIFTSGIVVNLKQNDISLSFEMLLPETFKGKTNGLLGVWDDIKENDFTLPNGEIIDITSNASQVHWTFCQKWLVNEGDSLFLYPDGKEHKDFVNETYEPLFLDAKNLKFANKQLEKEAIELCQGIKECLFDVAASGMISFGNATKEAFQGFNDKKKDINTVRTPIYFNCDGSRVKDRCDACGSLCPQSTNAVAIALAVIISITAASLVIAGALLYTSRKIIRKRKVVELEEKPARPSIPPRKKPQPENAPSAMTNMVFVLPELPQDT